MKALRIIASIIALLALAYYAYQYFGKPNGKEYDYDKKHSVYYKGEGLTEADAKKAANYLHDLGYFANDNEASIQITSSKELKDTIGVHFIVQKDKVTPEVETAFTSITADMANKIFNGKPVHLYLTDKYFDNVKDLGYVPPAQQQTEQKTDTETIKKTDDEK